MISGRAAVEAVLRAAMQRLLAGRVVGWSFALRDEQGELAAFGDGWARAPWEGPGLAMTADSRCQFGSMSKSVTSIGLMALMDDWNRLLAEAQSLVAQAGWVSDWFRLSIPLRRSPPAAALRLLETLLGKQSDFILRVLRDGKPLHADRSVAELLAGQLRSNVGAGVEDITLAHLLTHQSGIDFDAMNLPDPADGEFDFWGTIRTYLRSPVAWAPGQSKPGYRNEHFRLVRAVIEECAAEDYESFIIRRVVRRSGASSLSLVPDAENGVRYYGRDASLDPEMVAPPRVGGEFGPYRRLGGAYGWYGSMRDLTKLLQAFQAGSIVSPESRDRALAGRFAFYPETHTDGIFYGHNGKWGGGVGGMNGAHRLLADGRTAAFVTNITGVDADSIIRQTLDALLPVFEVYAPSGVVPAVRIINPFGVGDLHVTLDGRPATPAAPTVTDVLFFGGTTTVRACVFEAGRRLSRESTVEMGVVVRPPRPADAPSGGRPLGLEYRYVEGAFDKLPDFDCMNTASVQVGTAAAPDLSQASRGTNFAIEYRAYLEVPATGEYAFTIQSDDGSRFWVGDTLVVDNDGRHGPLSKSGHTLLTEGCHLVRIQFFQRGGGKLLQLNWSGPGVEEGPIPASQFLLPEPAPAPVCAPPVRARGGLRFRLAHGVWERFPEDLRRLPPLVLGVLSDIRLPPHQRLTHYALEFEGWLEVVTAGEYTFELSSDDGSLLWLNDVMIINNDGLHATLSESAALSLDVGRYPIRVQYFQRTGGSALSLSFRIGSGQFLPIPSERFWFDVS